MSQSRRTRRPLRRQAITDVLEADAAPGDLALEEAEVRIVLRRRVGMACDPESSPGSRHAIVIEVASAEAGESARAASVRPSAT